MKRFALATLLSSLLVAGLSVADYFALHSVDGSSSLPFWLSAILGTSLIRFIALLPAAVTPPTLMRSAIAVVLASCLGTLLAVALVVLRISGSMLNVGSSEAEIRFQLELLLLPAAIALVIGIVWRYWCKQRARGTPRGPENSEHPEASSAHTMRGMVRRDLKPMPRKEVK